MVAIKQLFPDLKLHWQNGTKLQGLQVIILLKFNYFNSITCIWFSFIYIYIYSNTSQQIRVKSYELSTTVNCFLILICSGKMANLETTILLKFKIFHYHLVFIHLYYLKFKIDNQPNQIEGHKPYWNPLSENNSSQKTRVCIQFY